MRGGDPDASEARLDLGQVTGDRPAMTHFRLRWQKLGGHVHVHVWSGTARETTHGRNGSLVFRENEWDDFVQLMAAAHMDAVIEIVPQDAVLSALLPAPASAGEGATHSPTSPMRGE